MTTCDRLELLPAAIRAVLAMKFDDFELIVSDNFSQPSAHETVSRFADRRIRYLRTDRRLNMAAHWDFAWQHVRGDFVMYLGDDNALHPDILAFANQAISQHNLQLLSWRNCSYFHPGWDIAVGNYPYHGNVLTFDPGTTGRLYRGDPSRLLQSYCDTLGLPAGFPVMQNCLFSRELAELIRRRTGRVFWPVNPDISVSYFVLGTMRPDAFGLLDSIGSVTGRSRNSIMADLASKGKKSRRASDLFAEYGDEDPFPHHPVKFGTMANSLAATASQAAALMPEEFGSYGFSRETLLRRVVQDIYWDRTVPWADDPAFLRDVELLLEALPQDARDGVLAYRAQLIQARNEADAASSATPAVARSEAPRPPRDPRGLWIVGQTYYVDMELFGARDIADVAAKLPRVLSLMDCDSERYIARIRALGHVGDVFADPTDLVAEAPRSLPVDASA